MGSELPPSPVRMLATAMRWLIYGSTVFQMWMNVRRGPTTALPTQPVMTARFPSHVTVYLVILVTDIRAQVSFFHYMNLLCGSSEVILLSLNNLFSVCHSVL